MSRTEQGSLEALASLPLTPREAEVLFWISQGKSNHDIGVLLGTKTGTICKHFEKGSGPSCGSRQASQLVCIISSVLAAESTLQPLRLATY